MTFTPDINTSVAKCLYLDFVSGILLSITQLSGFVSAGLSLACQLEKKNSQKVLVSTLYTDEGEIYWYTGYRLVKTRVTSVPTH